MNKILVQFCVVISGLLLINGCELDGSCPTRNEVFFAKFDLPDSVEVKEEDTIKAVVWGIDCMTEVNFINAESADTVSVHAVVTYNLCDCPQVEADTNCLITFSFEDKGLYVFRYIGLTENRDSTKIMQDSIKVY